MYYVFMQMLSSGPAWLSIILLITISLLPDVIKKVLCRAVCPTATERAQVRPRQQGEGLDTPPRMVATASCDITKGCLRERTSLNGDTFREMTCFVNDKVTSAVEPLLKPLTNQLTSTDLNSFKSVPLTLAGGVTRRDAAQSTPSKLGACLIFFAGVKS